jgi:hypothetical protein
MKNLTNDMPSTFQRGKQSLERLLITSHSRANPLLAFIKSIVMTFVNHVSMLQAQMIHQDERVSPFTKRIQKKKKKKLTPALF